MTETTRTESVPQTVTVSLRVRGGAAALEYYAKAFGAVEDGERMTLPDGRVGHAEMRIGNSKMMLGDEFPEYNTLGPQSIGGSSVTIALEVPDVDAVVERAVAGGGKLELPPADQFYGYRVGRVFDPFGHLWMVMTKIEEVTPEEMRRREAAWSAENAPPQPAASS